MPPNPPKRLSRGGSPHGVVRGGVVRTPPLHLSPAHLPSAYLPPALFAPPHSPQRGWGPPYGRECFGGGGTAPRCPPAPPGCRAHPGACKAPLPAFATPPPPALQAGHRPRVARVCVQLGTRRFAHTCMQVHTHAHACPYRCACVCTHAHRRTRMCSWFWGARGSQRVPQVFSPPPKLCRDPPPALPVIAALTASTVIISLSSPGSHRQGFWYQQGWGASAGCEGGGHMEGDIAGTRVRVERK